MYPDFDSLNLIKDPIISLAPTKDFEGSRKPKIIDEV